MHIVQIETWSIELPLARPIVVARQRVSQRRSLMLRITDELGVCGLAAGLLRGAAPAAELRADWAALRLFRREPAASGKAESRLVYRSTTPRLTAMT